MRSAALLLVLGLAACAGPSEMAQTQTAQTETLPHLVDLPDGYADGEEAWPVLLFLHGAGERGSDLGLVTAHGPPRLVREGRDLPFIVVSPQIPDTAPWPDGLRWEPGPLMALLDEIEAEYRVDPSRIYVTGLSMGGYGTWALVSAHPERFAAAVPICGGGDPGTVCAAREVPVWAFHGDADRSVPVEQSEAMVAALRACGGDVQFTVYPGVGHDSWTQTYADPGLYDWLLSHSR